MYRDVILTALIVAIFPATLPAQAVSVELLAPVETVKSFKVEDFAGGDSPFSYRHLGSVDLAVRLPSGAKHRLITSAYGIAAREEHVTAIIFGTAVNAPLSISKAIAAIDQTVSEMQVELDAASRAAVERWKQKPPAGPLPERIDVQLEPGVVLSIDMRLQINDGYFVGFRLRAVSNGESRDKER